ncbi:WxL domain-containing protein [Bacillus massiliglaciei]|uniref:WxL domain-containing protein n=1 Tax=Bacillus massiliglaciei TaxID=1816693 RepID=UPI000DA6005A|nr:WxL domain-containing protein [Bacillus massiliglaciei]
MKKIIISLTAAFLMIPIIQNTQEVEASTKEEQIPSLKVYQDDNHTKMEWAIEMLDEDVLYQTGFEANDELPRLTYNASGNRQYGGQSFTSEEKFSGNQSLKVVDSSSNGNYRETDLNGKETFLPYSAAIFTNRKYMENGTDLSVSFRAKTNGAGSINIYGSGGYADYGQQLNITFLENVSKGDLTAKVSNPEFFQNYINRGIKYYLATEKGKYSAYRHVTSVDMETSTITLNASFLGDFAKGDRVLKHNYRSPVSFNNRAVSKNDGWSLFNVNTKVIDYEDYNTLINGFELWIRTTTNDTVYIDDLKLGYATKSQLFRGDKKIYEGYLSDFTDSEAVDKTKPDKVGNYSIQKENDKFYISIKPVEDRGSEYKYSVGAVAHDGSLYKSAIETVEITSGVKGYSFVFDNNPNTNPGTNINTTGKIEVPINTNANSYLHIKSIDNAGNASDTMHISMKDIVKKKLEVMVPEIKSLGSIELQDQPKTYKTSFNSNFHIQNFYPGSDEGWRLSVSASHLKLLGESYTLPQGSISLEPLSSIKRISEAGGGNAPTNVMTQKSIIDNGAVTVLSALSGDGIGEYEFGFPENALSIVIDPTTAKVGEYQSTLTWDLISAP